MSGSKAKKLRKEAYKKFNTLRKNVIVALSTGVQVHTPGSWQWTYRELKKGFDVQDGKVVL